VPSHCADGQLELPLIPDSSPTDPPSCTPSAVENLIDMLPAVLVGCLKVLELLAKVFDVRFEVRCFCLQPLVDFACRAENEPCIPVLTLGLVTLPNVMLSTRCWHPTMESWNRNRWRRVLTSCLHLRRYWYREANPPPPWRSARGSGFLVAWKLLATARG
jgi:hypothetical protein